MKRSELSYSAVEYFISSFMLRHRQIMERLFVVFEDFLCEFRLSLP